MLLRTERGGAIGYVNPRSLEIFNVTWANAMELFETQALGISEADHSEIPMFGSGNSATSMGNRLKGNLMLRVGNHGAITYVDMNGYGHNVTFENLIPLFESVSLGISETDYSQL
jgi:hypothetical protein